MPVKTLQLAVAPSTVRFTTETEAELCESLREQEQNTKVMSLKLPGQIMLNREGRVQGELGLSTIGLSQLCSTLAPGLSLVIKDLCSDKHAPDPELAVKTLNNMIRLRFKSDLEERRLIIDTRTGTIDGIVGPKYVQLSNSELYQRSKSFVGRSAKPVLFHEAAISGRRMMVQYRTADPVFRFYTTKDSTIDPWFGGYHFSNSEVGECAVRAATLVMRQICSNGAVGPVEEGGRLAHVKADNFDERFEKLLDRVQKKAHEVHLIQQNIPALVDNNLGLGGQEGDHSDRCAYLLRRLRRGGLPKKFATRVVSRTIACAANDIRPLTTYKDKRPTLQEVQSRNQYDLFNALTYESKALPVSLRESAEQLAYLMLLGRFTIL